MVELKEIKNILKSRNKYIEKIGVVDIKESNYADIPSLFVKVQALFHQGWINLMLNFNGNVNILILDKYMSVKEQLLDVDPERLPKELFDLIEKPKNITNDQYKSLVMLKYNRIDFPN